jgi:integrase
VEKAEKQKARRRIAEQQGASNSLLLDHVIDRYWQEVGQHHVGADHTFRDLGRLIDFFGKDKLLTEITDNDVTKLVAWRRGHRVLNRKLISNSTVNVSTTEVLKKLFTCAKRKWSVRFDREPDWKAHMLPEPTERVRELVGDESDRLEGATRADFRPFFEFVRESGLRRKECLLLRWSEVNWAGGQIVKLGKGGRRIATPLTPTIRAILEPLQGHHPEFVFTYVAQHTKKGNVRGRRYPLTLGGLKSAWQQIRKRAGVTGFRFHDFRHDFATKILRRTGNLKLVQKALNHADIKTTTRYAHVLNDEIAEAMEQVSRDRRALRNSDENHRKNHRSPDSKAG